MNFTESNTVEQMILDAATSLGSGAGSSVVREDPPSGLGGSLGEEFNPSRWISVAATALPRQPGEVIDAPAGNLARHSCALDKAGLGASA